MKSSKTKNDSRPPICKNRKAYHEYQIDTCYEAGIKLIGTEVKSLRAGKVNMSDGYAQFDAKGELYLYNVHISSNKFSAHDTFEPKRPRKLLLKKQELRRIFGKLSERGYTLVPTKLYFNKAGLAKVEVGLAKGKKLYDKRAALKAKQLDRDTKRDINIANSRS